MNDYYKEIHCNFLVSEFERCKIDKENYKGVLQSYAGQEDIIKILQTQIDRFERKEKIMEQMLLDIAKELEISETGLSDIVLAIKQRQKEYFKMKNYRIKSKI